MDVQIEETCGRPVVSVLIPAFYSGDTVYEALESVLRQTEQNWEIILCDDGTEGFDGDTIEEIVRPRLPKGSGLTVLHQPTNVGTVKNLNAGLRASSGEWILLLAADDVLASPNVLALLTEVSCTTEKNWIIAQTELCDEHLCPIGKRVPNEIEAISSMAVETLYESLCKECFLPASGTLIRRGLLEKFGGFDEQYRLVEDWPLFLKAVREGEIPQILSAVSVLHRAGGVSGRSAAKNCAYQRDLVETMRREILPHLDMFSEQTRKEITRLCEDKMAVYSFRFECNGFLQKVLWVARNLGVITRSAKRKWSIAK